MIGRRTETCEKRIKMALSIRNMKQSELCKLANVPKSSLSLYLSGAYEPKQDRIYSMAKVLDVSEAWLMGYDVPMNKEQIDINVELNISPEEEIMLKLFRQIPNDKQEMVIQMVKVALSTK